MRTIHKYPVEDSHEFTVRMPQGAVIMSVQCQYGQPHFGALVDTERPKVSRQFQLRGTGHDCDVLHEGQFVGTFQLDSGNLVFHLFDLGER